MPFRSAGAVYRETRPATSWRSATSKHCPRRASTICWLQQEFLDRQASLRVGQIALDDEFYVSQYSANFVNSTFGCPDILSTDLPSGGPCYPFAVPGARLRTAPTTDLTFSATVFNGNPAPPGPGDPQLRNSSGTNVLIGEGGFMTMAELAYAFDEEPISSSRLSDVKFGS